MRHLLTSLALLATFAASAQSMPYNPDANDDGYIGSPDLLSFLPLFGSQVGIDSSLTCDYDGTPFEEFIAGLFDQTIIMDSLYIEYLIVDSVLTYLPGCPDPVVIETVLERSYTMVTELQNMTSIDRYFGYDPNQGSVFRELRLSFNFVNGTYSLRLGDSEVAMLTSYGQYTYWSDDVISLPFPDEMAIGEDGFVLPWEEDGWVANCQFFRAIPIWHYAE